MLVYSHLVLMKWEWVGDERRNEHRQLSNRSTGQLESDLVGLNRDRFSVAKVYCDVAPVGRGEPFEASTHVELAQRR